MKENRVLGAKITNIAVAVLLVVSGVFLLVFPSAGRAAMRWLVGANCVLIGAAKLFGYFCNDMYRLAFQFDLGLGIFTIIAGGIVFFCDKDILTLLPIFIGIYVMLDSMLRLQTAVDAKRFGMGHWCIMLITSIVLTVAGAVPLIMAVFGDAYALVGTGVALIADGAYSIFVTAYTVRLRSAKTEK